MKSNGEFAAEVLTIEFVICINMFYQLWIWGGRWLSLIRGGVLAAARIGLNGPFKEVLAGSRREKGQSLRIGASSGATSSSLSICAV